MANIPGWISRIPGVFGPINYPVKLVDDNFYYIRGYSSTEFKGTPKDIAKQIILDLANKPETGARKNYVGPFWLDFSDGIRCIFCQNPNPEPPDLDYVNLAKEISKELNNLKHLLPFM